MHDIRAIRDDPAAFDAGLARRGMEAQAGAILALDEQRRALQTAAQNAQQERNRLSKEFGRAKAQGEPSLLEIIQAQLAQLGALGTDLGEKEVVEVLNDQLSSLPNIPAPDVPDGADESDNVEQARIGAPPAFAFAAREHADFGPALGLDFESAAAISGARFAVLRGQMARLHRALGQYMLDTHTGANGYTETAPPLLVRREAMFGTGQLPKFEEDLFATTDDRFLIPTAEVSLTNLVRERILDAATLPIRLTALTPCFRAEAGAAGRDTRGLIRQHQFDKVELVTIAAPETSEAEHAHMLASAEGILTALGLPFRRMLLCAGDMGFAARKTYDLEVWLPGQGRYREISSISNCGDFQARRMNARFRMGGEKGTRFVHTLNGSGLAVGRALVAVLENYQEADGGVRVPEVLSPYMGGIERLVPA